MVHGWKGRKPAAKTEKQIEEEAAERARAAADAGLRVQSMPSHIAEIVGWCDEQDKALGAKPS